MAPTLVSGTIIAEQAGGDRTASLMVTIVINIIAVFSIPINLSWTLGAEVHLAIMPLLYKLISLVLIPAIIGHTFRRKKEKLISSHKVFFKYLPIFCLGIVIYISMSQQAHSIKQLTLRMLIEYSIGSILVHGLLLYLAYGLALKFNADSASAKSTAICSSQKTIPITVAIWTSEFSTYSLALLPAIVFHLCQIYFDGIIAKKWSRSST
jgi:predicted Na+-dependent transporter